MTEYERARQRIAGVMQAIMSATADRSAEELLGYAHGCDDAAYKLLGKSNLKREEEEEAEWSRMLAL